MAVASTSVAAIVVVGPEITVGFPCGHSLCSERSLRIFDGRFRFPPRTLPPLVDFRATIVVVVVATTSVSKLTTRNSRFVRVGRCCRAGNHCRFSVRPPPIRVHCLTLTVVERRSRVVYIYTCILTNVVTRYIRRTFGDLVFY